MFKAPTAKSGILSVFIDFIGDENSTKGYDKYAYAQNINII